MPSWARHAIVARRGAMVTGLTSRACDRSGARTGRGSRARGAVRAQHVYDAAHRAAGSLRRRLLQLGCHLCCTTSGHGCDRLPVPGARAVFYLADQHPLLHVLGKKGAPSTGHHSWRLGPDDPAATTPPPPIPATTPSSERTSVQLEPCAVRHSLRPDRSRPAIDLLHEHETVPWYMFSEDDRRRRRHVPLPDGYPRIPSPSR